MTEPAVTLDTFVDAIGPLLLAAGFEAAGDGTSGPFTWVRFRRQETRNGERCVRLVTLSHAPDEQAFLADSYLVVRRTYTYSPAGREMRRYGADGDAAAAVASLVAAVRGWVGA